MPSKSMRPFLAYCLPRPSLHLTNGFHFNIFNTSLNEGEKITTSSISTLRMPIQIEYLALILTVLIVIRFVQKKWLTKKSWIDALPGPRTYPLVGGLLYFSADLTQNCYFDALETFKILLDWNKKYGPIFRSEGLYNEPYIFLQKPKHIQAVLSSNHVGSVSKPKVPYDSIFGQFLKNGLLVSEGEYWKSHRRILSRAFTYKSLYGYIKIFNQYSKRLVDDLEKRFPDENMEPKQINTLIHCCSLQIICVSVMGLDVCESKEGILFNEMFQRYKIISCQRATYFWFLLDFFWKLHPISREYNSIIETLDGITRKIIENRSNNNVKDINPPRGITRQSSCSSDTGDDCDIGARPRRSMIDEMLASEMTQEEILVEANTVIVAGYESTSLTIQYMLLLLALHPEHQRACQQEIDELFDDPIMCSEGNFTMDALMEMKYLEMCCLETLRLFPVIFTFQRKPQVSIKLDENMELPAGMNVVIPTYSIHRNPEYFPEPNKFDPDRFLPESNENRHPYAFIPFSGGIRNCIGYKFALLEIKAVVARILRNFDISTVDKIDEVPILPSIVMTPMRDYKFVLKRRFV